MDEVETLRRFNRCYTQRIGVLAESYLDSGRALGPSRLLSKSAPMELALGRCAAD